jgi:hypothetical protein
MVILAPPLLNYSNKISKGLFDGSTGFKIDGGLKGDFETTQYKHHQY